MYSGIFKKSAEKELLGIPDIYANRISIAIDTLAHNPRPHGCKKLFGSHNEYRIRIGDYRVIYTISDEVLTVCIIKIAHRKDAYR